MSFSPLQGVVTYIEISAPLGPRLIILAVLFGFIAGVGLMVRSWLRQFAYSIEGQISHPVRVWPYARQPVRLLGRDTSTIEPPPPAPAGTLNLDEPASPGADQRRTAAKAPWEEEEEDTWSFGDNAVSHEVIDRSASEKVAVAEPDARSGQSIGSIGRKLGQFYFEPATGIETLELEENGQIALVDGQEVQLIFGDRQLTLIFHRDGWKARRSFEAEEHTSFGDLLGEDEDDGSLFDGLDDD